MAKKSKTSSRINRMTLLATELIALVPLYLPIPESEILGWALLLLLYGLIFFILRAQVLRFHDLGQSGWYVLLGLLPFVNIYYAFKLLLVKGEPKANQYGKPATDIDLEKVFLFQ